MTLSQDFAYKVDLEIQRHNELPRNRRKRRPTILAELKLAYNWLTSCGIKVTPIKDAIDEE